MSNHKHFTLSERFEIEHSLKDSLSFKAIAKILDKDCSSISKEIKKHITKKKNGNLGRAFNNCIHRFDCRKSNVCRPHCTSHRGCRFCSNCCSSCSDFIEFVCPLLSKPPYVCNGCSERLKCTLEKSLYLAASAQNDYVSLLSQSRQGINIDEGEISRLNDFISPLILKGQSIHHICSNNLDTIMCGERTIYNYVNLNLFSARNILLSLLLISLIFFILSLVWFVLKSYFLLFLPITEVNFLIL